MCQTSNTTVRLLLGVNWCKMSETCTNMQQAEASDSASVADQNHFCPFVDDNGAVMSLSERL